MQFVVDAQLPPALARMLAGLGHTAEHVADIGLRDAEDSPIREYALEKEAVVVTKDEDFAYRHGPSRIAQVLGGCGSATPAAGPSWNGSNRSSPKLSI